MNYDEAKALFTRARNKERGKKIDRNTYVRRIESGAGDLYAVRLHATDILTFYPDGSVRYDSGGWRTMTTSARMNAYGPASVWSVRGDWYIAPGGSPDRWTRNAHPYREGVRVLADGSIEGAASPDELKRERALRRAAKDYAENYTKALTSGAIGEPSGGDCWFCVMRSQNGKPLGEEVRDGSHIEGHINERYYVPALAWNALEAGGAGDAYKQYVAACQHGQPRAAFGGPGSFVEKRVRRMIRRYVTRQLGLAA